MQVEITDSIANIDERSWNRLVADRYPFLRHEFLLAAEQSGSVCPATGWLPQHICLRDKNGELTAAMPLYEKSHSWGEFVFDWNWAQAYEQAGLAYYPKLVSAVPFTPAPSARLLASDDDAKQALLCAALDLAKDKGHSSLHILFPQEDELPILQAQGLKLRKDCQFHWHNDNYETFDRFLDTFSASKRKKSKRDRRHVSEQGISFRWIKGQDIDSAIWADVYQLISITFMRRGSMPYFSEAFFIEITKRIPENILLIVAEKNHTMIAAAVFFVSASTLYGRYWGSDSHYNALHFETCYYQGIEYCITHKLQRFEPGTQGEHKLSRGFRPVETWSAHWLARPEFFAAVGNYLDEEAQHVDRYIEATSAHSPFRSQPNDKTPQSDS